MRHRDMLTPPASWSAAKPWREFFDILGDAVIVLDNRARVVFANTAALRLLPCEAAMPLDQLRDVLGAPAVRWLTRAAVSQPEATPPPPLRLADGRAATFVWRRIDARHSAVRLQVGAVTAPSPGRVASGQSPALREAIGLIWELPFPASLQGDDFRFIDVNQAFLDVTGYTRDQIAGHDPLEFVPDEEKPGRIAARERRQSAGDSVDEDALMEGRFVDAGGRERWFRRARRVLVDAEGAAVYLALMQDTTAERVARERAERSARELDDWFDLSPVGMVLYDQSGLLVRTNPAFDALVGRVPVLLREAPASLQALLGWHDGAPLASLQPGSPAFEGQGFVAPAGGDLRRLSSIVRCYRTAGGQPRYMAVVEDRSVEEERDLAQVQIGALMDTAGVGLATFQESSGWVRQRQQGGSSAATPAATAALQSISRDIVAPGSMPEYEKLQSALRHAERAEVRYQIEHPELGQRWLLTRVEPATLASGKRTTSVVTLDVTEQQRSQQRSEQLLREMTTILESTTAGIAYLRGHALVRCNRRFETMLGLDAGAAPGTPLEALFGRQAEAGLIAIGGLRSLAVGDVHEAEFELADPSGSGDRRWYSLSVRRAGTQADPAESIAVLSDVTRMKTQQIELEVLARDRELMFSLSEVGIAFVRDRRIQRANGALAELTGWTVEELSSLELAALFVDAADFKRRWPLEERDLALHGRWSGERQIRRRDGRLVWVQISKRLVNRSRPLGGIIASYVDVDARHRAERAVSLQAERTRSILDSVLVGIVNVGPHGIEWMNRSARRMFGGSLADFVGESLATVATDESDHPFRLTQRLTELEEGQAETFECRVRARDGREFWIVGNRVVTERDHSGRQMTYALLDIERRRQAEARMTEAQSALQQVIEAAPLAIALIDARTLRVVQANEVGARAAATSVEQLVGRAPEEIFDAETAATLRRDLERARVAPGVTTCEYRLDAGPRTGNEARVWDARFVPLGAAPGHAAEQLLLVATDVTEQRAAQEARLEAAIAQREMLVKEVHHRIKNNLQGVAGLLQQIAERKPEVAAVISEVVGQVQAIAQVYGLQVGEQGPLRILGVVEAIAASVQRTFGQPIRCRVEGPLRAEWALPEAEAIPIALTLNELLTNALKHGAPGTKDTACEVECDEAGVRISISNEGRLPPGFNLAGIPGGVSGLGLVRALVPRRHAVLAIAQHGDRVVASVTLSAPVVTRTAGALSGTIPRVADDARPGGQQ